MLLSISKHLSKPHIINQKPGAKWSDTVAEGSLVGQISMPLFHPKVQVYVITRKYCWRFFLTCVWGDTNIYMPSLFGTGQKYTYKGRRHHCIPKNTPVFTSGEEALTFQMFWSLMPIHLMQNGAQQGIMGQSLCIYFVAHPDHYKGDAVPTSLVVWKDAESLPSNKGLLNSISSLKGY